MWAECARHADSTHWDTDAITAAECVCGVCCPCVLGVDSTLRPVEFNEEAEEDEELTRPGAAEDTDDEDDDDDDEDDEDEDK